MLIRSAFLFILVGILACQPHQVPDDEIRIGAIASLVGAAGEQGKNWLNGARLAAEDLQSNGVNIKLIIEDDQTEPVKAISAFTKLAQVDKVHGIVGGTWDYLGEACYPLALRYKTPFITPTNPPEVLSQSARDNPYVFSNSMTLSSMRIAVENFLRAQKIKRLALIYPNLPFGQQQAAVLDSIAKDHHIEVVYRYEFPVSGAMRDNVKLAALRLQQSHPDGVFAVLDYNGLDLLTLEFKALSYFPTVITTQHLDQAFSFSKDPSRYKQMYAVYPKTNSVQFKERFAVRFGEEAKVYAEHGYDAVILLVQLRKAGITLGTEQVPFAYEGLTGTHTLPAPTKGLVLTQATIMTTRNGIFEELYSKP